MNESEKFQAAYILISKLEKAFPQCDVPYATGLIPGEEKTLTAVLKPKNYIASNNIDSLTNRNYPLRAIKFKAKSMEELKQQVGFLINLYSK